MIRSLVGLGFVIHSTSKDRIDGSLPRPTEVDQGGQCETNEQTGRYDQLLGATSLANAVTQVNLLANLLTRRLTDSFIMPDFCLAGLRVVTFPMPALQGALPKRTINYVTFDDFTVSAFVATPTTVRKGGSSHIDGT